MYRSHHITAVIPALNEENSVGTVVKELLALKVGRQSIVDRVIVCDNGSTDETSKRASSQGAEVVFESEKGYGAACLRAISQVESTDILIFVNADKSENISETQC